MISIDKKDKSNEAIPNFYRIVVLSAAGNLSTINIYGLFSRTNDCENIILSVLVQ